MNGLELFGIISAGLNVAAAVAAWAGWRIHRTLRRAARRLERTGEAIIQGVEACETVLGTRQAKQIKRSVRNVAEAAGCESALHAWLGRLGLANDGGNRAGARQTEPPPRTGQGHGRRNS